MTSSHRSNTLNVLVVGSGGREHALAWALSRSPRAGHVYVTPGNAGTSWSAADGRCACSTISISTGDTAGLLDFARSQSVGLTVVGPELPLANGIVDTFQAAGLPIFGPTKAAARLESSKAYAKTFMYECGIPTAAYGTFAGAEGYETARRFVGELDRPVVIKADGLAAGKGVVVCDTPEEAFAALHRIMIGHEFGGAGHTVIVEERLSGREVSVLAFSDGRNIVVMPPARDHKRAYDGDKGPNTGGMGAYAPVPDLTNSLLNEIEATVLKATIEGMAARGTPYTGVLYAGLMLTTEGPKLLEFNCRFGDPETQAIVPLLESDLLELMLACVEGDLGRSPIAWHSGACATIVLAAPGYPEAYPKGLPISGVAETTSANSEDMNDVLIFHAGTMRREQDGKIVTAGGRVLSVSGRGATLVDAITRAYHAVQRIHFDRMHYRRDIGFMSGVHL